jgi:hypothetical protein
MTSLDSRHTGPETNASSVTSPPAWLDLLPSAALVLAFSIKAALQPQAVRDVFSGTQAFVVTFAIALGWVVLWLALRRMVRNGWIRTAILAVVAAFLIYWLVVSALVDKKVVETLPGAARTEQQQQQQMMPSAPDEEAPTPASSEPVLVATGTLRGIDHDATGTAALYQRPDGSFIVGLEQIDIEPGPDYKLYVVPGAGRESPGDDGVFLEDLRGNQGTQYYDVPSDVGFDPGDWTVLVWCRAFAVPIANATPV